MTWQNVLTSPWLGLSATLFFGCLSVYFFLRSRGHRRVVWTYALAAVQTKAHPDIDILFRGEPIKNLTRLLVLCWNDGTREIRPSDIPKDGHPGLSFDKRVRVLSTSVLGMSTPESGLLATLKQDHFVEVSFEFLNPGDGGLVEVLFEDVAEVSPSFVFRAPLIGGRPWVVRRYTPGRSVWDRLFVTTASLGIAVVATAFVGRSVWKLFVPPGLPIAEFWVALVAALFGSVGGLGFWHNVREFMDHRLPTFGRSYFEPRSNKPLQPTSGAEASR